MRLARKLGTITYRSASEWKHRFGRRPASDRRYQALPPGRAHFPAEFAVQDYLNAALKRAAAEQALVIGVESDILFTINEQNSIADAFEAAATATEFVRLASLEGHDAFLVDIEPFAAAIGRFLANS